MRLLFVFFALVTVPFIYQNKTAIIHKSDIKEKPISYMSANEAAKKVGEHVEFVCNIRSVFTADFREGNPTFLNIENNGGF